VPGHSYGITTTLTTTGCGKRPPTPPGSSANEMLRSGGLLRYYRLHVPTGYRPTRYTPLVFSFHGHNSDMMAQERLTGFSTLANQQGFLVAYPQGTVGPDGETGWATGPRKDPTVNDVHFVSDLLTHLQSTLCVDPQRVYATGFSNGGAMTAMLACTMAGRMAAFASVSGSYYPLAGGCHPSRPAPIFEMHGTADTTVPYNGDAALRLPPIADWLADWAQRDGCASQPVPFFQLGNTTAERWSDCQGDAMIIHYRIEGGKHDWPQTISAPGSSLKLSTTGLIWSFLQEHLLLRQD
jgi:polyhydroxybutyrate depolymerase